MSNVLEFPEERSVKKNLNVVKTELDGYFENIKTCYSAIEKLEKEIEKAEKKYDELFGRYVRAVGLDNVEVKFLEYVSRNIKVNIETGEITYEEELKIERPEDTE